MRELTAERRDARYAVQLVTRSAAHRVTPLFYSFLDQLELSEVSGRLAASWHRAPLYTRNCRQETTAAGQMYRVTKTNVHTPISSIHTTKKGSFEKYLLLTTVHIFYHNHGSLTKSTIKKTKINCESLSEKKK